MKHKITHVVVEVLKYIDQLTLDRFYLADLKDFLQERNEYVPSESTLFRVLDQLKEDDVIWKFDGCKSWRPYDDVEIKLTKEEN